MSPHNFTTCFGHTQGRRQVYSSCVCACVHVCMCGLRTLVLSVTVVTLTSSCFRYAIITQCRQLGRRTLRWPLMT
jgi:hypothetical protein